MNDVVKHIEFGTVRKPLNSYRARLIYELILDCIKDKKVLDDYVLQDWWLEKLVKPRNRIMQTKYLGKDVSGQNVWQEEKEYDYIVRLIKEHHGLLPSYYWTEARQALKYHIGNLVVNGYLIALPKIKISAETNEIQEQNKNL